MSIESEVFADKVYAEYDLNAIEFCCGPQYQDSCDDYDLVMKSPGIVLKKDISNVVLRYSNNESYDIDNISNEQEDLNKEINQNDIIYNRSKSKQVKKKENITNNVFKNRG